MFYYSAFLIQIFENVRKLVAIQNINTLVLDFIFLERIVCIDVFAQPISCSE